MTGRYGWTTKFLRITWNIREVGVLAGLECDWEVYGNWKGRVENWDV